MFTCPHCQKELQPQRGAQGVIYICPSCKGHTASLSVLRKVFGPERVAVLWADLDGPQDCACPVCRQAMRRVQWLENDQPIPLDLCRRCEFVWFDPQEYESIAPAPPKPRPLGEIDRSTLSPEAREKLAMIDVERLTREREMTDGPDENWQTMAGYLRGRVDLELDSSGAPLESGCSYNSSAVTSRSSMSAASPRSPISAAC
jgi:Zn-finger nucleic acid-binding protein